MKVLQLIDSLSVGGAERVAVNLANGLAEAGVQSYLCATRQEGGLRQSLNDKVNYLFLNKKGRFDFRKICSLIRYCRQEQIDLIHAHSTSVFVAAVVTLFCRRIKLVWHDHYGQSEFLGDRPLVPLRVIKSQISHVFSVNRKLEDWAVDKLCFLKEKVTYLPNFPDLMVDEAAVDLPGKKGCRMVCLANLRPQKDHENLLNAFRLVSDEFPEWSLLLVGRDFEDDYSRCVVSLIREMGLEGRVFFLGERVDVAALLRHCDIGVLSSKSEGLPVSLLEYGVAGLPVVSTSVGEISEVLGHGAYGTLVPPGDAKALAAGLRSMMVSHSTREEWGRCFRRHIEANYSKEAAIQQLLMVYQNILVCDE